MKSVNISDLDCIYLWGNGSTEKFWTRIQNLIPGAQCIEGVPGLDAYQCAADASNTERFILIDTNSIPNEDFFKQTLEFSNDTADLTTLQWKSRNHINGIVDTNGGLISFTRTAVNSMQTDQLNHNPLHWSMHDCYSTTYSNGSAFQAWAAGFKAGVQLCLNYGTRPTVTEFVDGQSQESLRQLSIWHNIGRDAEHGIWSIAGSRMGTYMMMITSQWDYHSMYSATELEKLWSTVKDSMPEILAGRVAEDLNTQLKLPMISMLAPESAFFKQHLGSTWSNQGVMVQDL
jgi:hypothetical protein